MKTVFIVALLISFDFVRSTGKERISRLKCQEYNELFKKNNICNDGTYPFVGAIGFDKAENVIQWTCSGALISEQYFLTAGHCVYNVINRSPAKYVRLGTPDFTDKSNGKIFNITKTIRHPYRKPGSHYNDIALFKLEKPVDFNKFIQPACVYAGEDLTEYDVAGFSLRSKGHLRDKPVFLHEKNKVATKEECNAVFPPNRKFPDGVKFDSQFCNKDGALSCQLSIASVFLHKDEELSCMQNIAGLINVGLPRCVEGTIGLNVKVSAFVDWIENVVWP